MLELSVIIVSYNTCQMTLDCIESVYKRGGVSDVEVIIVDNASVDDSRKAVADAYPEAKLFARSTNDGFAKANNQGIQESHGEYVMLLNSDTLVHDGSLRQLLDELKMRPEVGMIGPKLLNRDGSLQQSCAKDITIASTFNEYWRAQATSFYGEDDLKSSLVVDFLSGACMALPRKAIEAVGLLDESYFMYSEDMDWCYRVRQAGYQIVYFPEAVITHYGGGSSQKDALSLGRELHLNRIRVYRKYHSWLNGMVVAGIIWPRLWLKKLFGRIA